jgi:hypothetical protein
MLVLLSYCLDHACHVAQTTVLVGLLGIVSDELGWEYLTVEVVCADYGDGVGLAGF